MPTSNDSRTSENDSLTRELLEAKTPSSLSVSEYEWSVANQYLKSLLQNEQTNTQFLRRKDLRKYSQSISVPSQFIQHSFVVVNGALYAVQGIEFNLPDGSHSSMPREELSKTDRKQLKKRLALGQGYYGIVFKLQNEKNHQLAMKEVTLNALDLGSDSSKDNITHSQKTLAASDPDTVDLEDTRPTSSLKQTLSQDPLSLKNEMIISLKAGKTIEAIVHEEKNKAYIIMPVYKESLVEQIEALRQEIGNSSEEDTLSVIQKLTELMLNVCKEVRNINEEHGIIHGDIKFENFMLDEQGKVHLLDYGLSTMLPKDATGKFDLDAAVVHFLDYYSENSAPEVAPVKEQLSSTTPRAEARFSIQSDIYSTGNMFYGILSMLSSKISLNDAASQNLFNTLWQLTQKMSNPSLESRAQSWAAIIIALNNALKRSREHSLDDMNTQRPFIGSFGSYNTGSSLSRLPNINGYSDTLYPKQEKSLSGSGDSSELPAPKLQSTKVINTITSNVPPQHPSGYTEVFTIKQEPSGAATAMSDINTVLIEIKAMKTVCDRFHDAYYDCKLNLITLRNTFNIESEAFKHLSNAITAYQGIIASLDAPHQSGHKTFVASQAQDHITATNKAISTLLGDLENQLAILEAIKNNKPKLS